MEQRRVYLAPALLLLLGVLWLCTPQSVFADDPAPFCRFGVNINTLNPGPVSEITSYNTASLGIGWYINYHADATPAHPNGIEYAPMVRLSQKFDANTNSYSYTYSPNGAALQAVIAANPGADWFVGNEPDRILYQDSMNPETYAAAYHELYYLIKAADPKAKIFAGSIVQPTEIRLQYLDLILESYQTQFGEQMPVDGWSIHNFILNEQSCSHFDPCWGADIPPGIDALQGLHIGLDELEKHRDIELFKQQIQRFRVWMSDSGYTGLPVYLSEYGVLLPDLYTKPNPEDPVRPIRLFPPAKVNEFMNQTFDYLLNAADPLLGDPTDDYRLIQRFSWYSVNEKRDALPNFQYNGHLFNPTSFERSVMGENYASYVAALESIANVHVASVNVMPVSSSSISTEAIIQAQIANSGNRLTTQRADVRFFDKDPEQGGQQIGKVHPVALKGCGDNVLVEANWTRSQPDQQEVYITITPIEFFNYLPIAKK